MTRNTRITVVVAAVVCFALAHGGVSAQTKPAADADSVTVTAKYAGKGPVDASHRIWVWLFETPDINAGSMPVGEMSIEKNGGTATFTHVTSKEVYVAVAYDEKGGFMGQAPPPSGSPMAIYGFGLKAAAEDQPVAVVPGPKGKAIVTFADTQRMP